MHCMELTLSYIQSPCGTGNLWELVSVLSGQDDNPLPENYTNGIMHSNNLFYNALLI